MLFTFQVLKSASFVSRRLFVALVLEFCAMLQLLVRERSLLAFASSLFWIGLRQGVVWKLNLNLISPCCLEVRWFRAFG